MDRHEGHDSSKGKVSVFERDLHEIVSNKETLSRTTEMFLDSITDKIVLGIIFDVHRKYKTNTLDPIQEEMYPVLPKELNDAHIFNYVKRKRVPPCECPVPRCTVRVGPTMFASHLAGCMGKGGGQTKLRSSSRKTAINYGSTSDDEYSDMDWGSKKPKKKNKKTKNPNKKKTATVSKKAVESETVQTVNIDVEGDEDYTSNLQDLYKDSSALPSDSSKKRKRPMKIKKVIAKTDPTQSLP